MEMTLTGKMNAMLTPLIASLLLDLGNGDAVHIGNFDQNDVFNSSSVSGFEFADGSALTTSELLARGFDLEGTAGGAQAETANDASHKHQYKGRAA